ncbi:uncharacterized protein [Primulina huaijiensis]|uniref:uncharacterized protein n=1 Tax=Primulina huaijiensis TaxID=1492673 RepID=UPI003CC70A7F
MTLKLLLSCIAYDKGVDVLASEIDDPKPLKSTEKASSSRMASIKCMRRSQNLDLLIFDPEIERTARSLRKARREEIQAMADNRDNENPPPAIPIRDHFRPVLNAHYSGIARGTINAYNFELKPALINMVLQNQFGGAALADPHLHLRTFLEITDTELATKFLAKYFPPAKSAQLKIEISTFRQNDFEQLYEAWERYKELLRRCPNHGFEDWVQIELFYNGSNGQTRGTVDAAAGGTIFAKSPAQAYDLLEQMTINSYQWSSERSGVKKQAGIYAIDPITSLTAQVSALTTQIAAMNKASTSEVENASVVTEEPHIPDKAHYINNRNFGGYGGYRGNPPPNTYHPGLKNHENFSYANNKNVLNPPPGFNTSKGGGKPSFEDLLANALRVQNRGQFPSNTEVNPKELCKAVTLRSGKELEVQSPKKMVESEMSVEDVEFEVITEKKVEDSKTKVVQPPAFKPTIPYPQRFKKKSLDDQFAKFLEIFKKIHINIPFADALEQMPNYAKFIKDVMSKKRKLQEFETVKLTEECSAILQKKLPQKLKDPGSFTIPCFIGGSH